MADIDDSDFKSQRISLMILSVAIIMYVIGGGKVGTDGAIFGGTIHFDNPDIIIWTGLSLYVWFNWMLLLSSKQHINSFLLNLKYYIYSSSEYKQIATDFLGKIDSTKITGGLTPVHHLDQSIIYNNGAYNTRRSNLPPLLTNIFYPNTLFFNTDSQVIVDWDNKNVEPWKRVIEYPVPNSRPKNVITQKLPLLRMYWLELKCLYKVILFNKPFTFAIAPFILSIIAAFVLLWDVMALTTLTSIFWLIIFITAYYKAFLLMIFLTLIYKAAR